MFYLRSTKSLRLLTYIFTVLALIVLQFISPTRSFAAGLYVVNVNTTVDEYNTGTNCSLREAVQSANNGATLGGGFGGCVVVAGVGVADYEIVLPAGVYTLTIAGNNEDANATGDLDILSNITITGAAQATTFLQACDVAANAGCTGIDRLLDVQNLTTSLGYQFNLTEVTVRKGNTNGLDIYTGRGGALRIGEDAVVTIDNSTFTNNFGGYGGAIYHDRDSSLTITDSTFTNNSGANGGAISNVFALLNITNSTFSNNTATGFTTLSSGGSIHSEQSTMNLTDSVVQNSTAEVGGGITISCTNAASTGNITRTIVQNNIAQLGGGIAADGGNFACTINLNESTVTGNQAINRGNNSVGGGIWLYSGNLMVATNSTISGNSTEGTGGGIGNSGPGIRTNGIILNHVTLTNNVADSNNDGGTGGAIWRNANDLRVVYIITNSILSGNLVFNTPNECPADNVGSNGYNVFGQNGSANGCPTVGTDIVPSGATSTVLNPTLAINAPGTTPTHAVVTGSPAIDNVPIASCTVPNDQRGVARPQDGNGDTVNACDAGAYEVGSPEIDIQGNGLSIVDADTTPSTTDNTDFGSTPVGTAISQTFTIYNTGTADLTLGTVTVPTGFSVTTSPASPVAVGGNTMLTIQCDAASSGTFAGTVSIANNDGNENPYDFNITCLVTAPEIDVQGNATSIPDGAVTPNTLDNTDFGSTPIGVAVSRTFTILNTGNANLTLGAVTVPAGFSVATAPTSPVALGNNTSLTIQCDAASGGTFAGTVSIVNNDSNENPYDFNITCLVSATAGTQVPPQNPRVNVADPAIVKLGNPELALPGETVVFSLMVTNPGALPATNVIVTDPVPEQFSVLAATAGQGTFIINGNTVTFNIGTVNPGQNIQLTVTTQLHSDVQPPATLINTAFLDFAEGSRRSASATIRIISTALPSTGERPDNRPTAFNWTLVTSITLLALALLVMVGVFRHKTHS